MNNKFLIMIYVHYKFASTVLDNFVRLCKTFQLKIYLTFNCKSLQPWIKYFLNVYYIFLLIHLLSLGTTEYESLFYALSMRSLNWTFCLKKNMHELSDIFVSSIAIYFFSSDLSFYIQWLFSHHSFYELNSLRTMFVREGFFFFLPFE